MNYIYKIKAKFKKNPKLLEKYGFIPYQTEDEDEIVYAIGIVLPEDGSIFKYLKRAMEKIYTYATTEEREKDFKEYEFKEILTPDQQRDYELIITPEVKKQFTECQLCFFNSGMGEWSLFINAPDRVEYYNTCVLNENAKSIIDALLNDKVIYKRKAPKTK